MLILGCNLAPWNWDDCVREFLTDIVGQAFADVFEMLLDAIAKVVIETVVAIMTGVGFLWIKIDTPDISRNGAVWWMHERTQYIMVAVATVAVIVGAIQMAISHRGEPLRDILRSLITMVLVNAGLLFVASNLIGAADEFSQWIIAKALGGRTDFGTELANRMTKPLMDDKTLLTIGLVIFVGILMVITGIIQLALMIVRYGMLVLLTAVFPITAAATNTEMGMMWFKRALAWLGAFIIYKPVAALIYAAAIMMIRVPAVPEGVNPEKGAPQAYNIVLGVTMMLLAVVALPAILRFVSPKAS
ncbi:hypothetical protein HPO96_15885 [Kribbella sandramycini]|uniref:TrbL/VirB6 plasmid conjugal transfer protein n=1 Tax=Kribbella sandramycini TaxID=60450 RepID=A0A7Y4KZV2_9ACTN|nr:hypothetical protein [Kribbella sandramycini]MBB6565460.1 hypothetical protein [Kribbella sandramycini]NOL41728.1 hypothetical protein [Kribbella sandramycini]